MNEQILLHSDDSAGNPRLSEEEIELLEASGKTRSLGDGEVLYSAGEHVSSFYVVLDGRVRIEDHEDGAVRVLARLHRGNVLGEFGVLSGGLTLMTNVAEGLTRVLCVPTSRLLEVIAEEPVLSETILRAFLIRRSIMIGHGLGVRVVGPEHAQETRETCEYLARNRIPYTEIDTSDDEGFVDALRGLNVAADELPLVIVGECVLRAPSLTELAHELGIGSRRPRGDSVDSVIIGAGPAGLAASVYAASEGLSTVLVDAVTVGGQAATSSRIENFPGFPAGVSGGELAARTAVQAAKFGVELVTPAQAISLCPTDGGYLVGLADEKGLRGRAVLIATGAQYRGLQVARLEDLRGSGVFNAATQVEAERCRGGVALVVGGGNSAGQAAVFLAKYAEKVVIICRRQSLDETMSRYLIDRIEAELRIVVMGGTEVRELLGVNRLTGVVVERSRLDKREQVDADALFVFTGAVPNTGWLESTLELDVDGFIVCGGDVHTLPLETSLPGVFAAGDVRSGSTKRVATAVGEGALAITSMHQRLRTLV